MDSAAEDENNAVACRRGNEKHWALLGGSGKALEVQLGGQLSEVSLQCMSSSEGADGKAPADGGTSVPTTSTLKWILMTSVMFIYALINTGMALYILPVEARRMHPGSGGGIWVSISIAVCGVAQLVNPIAGKLSDRHASRLGKRRPFIIVGTGVAIAFLAGIWVASYNRWPTVFICSLLVAEIGLNVAFSAQCALPADIQAASSTSLLPAGPSKENADGHGVCSGVVAVQSILGSLCAMGLMVSTQSMAVQIQYPVYITGLAVCCCVVCLFTREQPSHLGPRAEALTWAELRDGFTVDRGRDSDFMWVCLGRMCYYVVTSALVFQIYYLEDMLHVYKKEDRNFKLGVMIVSAQAIGLVCSIPFGRLSNATGRKVIIYSACVVMSLAAVLQVVAPKVGPDGSWPMVWLSSVLAGLGNSAYLSVDYALALDCMPQGKTAAEAFGLWGIAGFAGSTVGPLFGGLVLHCTATVQSGRERYTYEGYAVSFLVLGVLANILVVCCTSRIKWAK